MSVPAGWYDDGSGRQRWWDGERWTDQFAPADENAPAATPEQAGASYPAPVAPDAAPPAGRKPAVWGFVGLGLAVVGTILGCIPVVPVIVPGMLLLFAALVVSIVALFVKNTAKWPAIVGVVLSVVGGIIAVFVLIGTLVFAAYEALPTGGSTPGAAQTPSSEPTESSEPADSARPSPDEIAAAMLRDAENEGLDAFDYEDPEFSACFGQQMYDSELTDEELQLFVAGDENAPTDDQYDRISQIGATALGACAAG